MRPLRHCPVVPTQIFPHGCTESSENQPWRQFMSKLFASERMKLIKQKDTKPEIIVRRLLHKMGIRFRLHVKGLPGTPDISMRKHATVVFVHGCFWHRHPGCRYASIPKTRQEFWLPKFAANVERDGRKATQLHEMGWRVLIVWECETKDMMALQTRLSREFFLDSARPSAVEYSGQ
ncbi:DNA mismatch endonuclease Vsr [Pseudomonas amygdali]|uniref:very short patch repair endonuclease n=1 Tax=Pseudomonas amygdali TaxID=47877 RepID=UPI002E267335